MSSFNLPPSLSQPLLTLLRLAPLLSTTASLTHAYMEYITTSSFLTPAPTTSSLSRSMLRGVEPTSSPKNTADVARATEVVAPVWFVNFFNRGLWSVIGLNSITLISAVANLWGVKGGVGAEARTFYLLGLQAGCAHYLFAPTVAPAVERLFGMCARAEKGEGERKEGASAVESVREWRAAHRLRMGSVDTVAWVSFLVGVTKCVGIL
ncbi:hypothetical protein DE146DRAFT_356869 [Phaeosphaeria sp. MPI-PUGE-AT-0046c]|nr:hypothetical protein DE146DRAFT_356869 [Phaeosphaeria sp. MPI-PUGE-AT-0046c]